MNPETKNKLSYKLSTASIVLIPIAIGINYLGKYIAAYCVCRFGWTRSERYCPVCWRDR